MNGGLLERALNAELQDASRALSLAECDVLITRWTGDEQGYQEAKGRKAAARSRVKQAKKALTLTSALC